MQWTHVQRTWNQKPMMPLSGEDWCRGGCKTCSIKVAPLPSNILDCLMEIWSGRYERTMSLCRVSQSTEGSFDRKNPARSHHAAFEFDRMRRRNETSITTAPQSISHQLAALCGVPVLHSTNCSYTFPKCLLSTLYMAERS